MPHRLDHAPFLVPPGRRVQLADYDPGETAGLASKKAAKDALLEDVSTLAEMQQLLWASAEYGVLIIFQALDAAGKDSAIRHVMSGVNPQGVDVYSFKAPTDEERLRHFLWRPAKVMPPRGRISIFNRSYYEEVLVVRVHPEWLENQWVPREFRDGDLKGLWQQRFDEINAFERLMIENGVVIIKFFLNVSRKEQRKRFLDRLDNPEKHWKFSASDIEERSHWDEYMRAYEDMLSHTSTLRAPWYVIPADHKWFTRACVADIIASRIEELDLSFPSPSETERLALDAARERLKSE
ncbi:Polyphosphate kinase 2 (PPK2) [Maioricimonas rarisocia]|uniref:Polyphosphate kinase 2 (PPK2) n=1 Tax=Maioricimonas rarisocia TaxID=2528026 RepID=A0A517Z0L0_9PLAN|nr:polyphosphate kinase 2 family protein [Maioricimonas rarisocia]QDU36017.1 Polyphosphate kinase 2 (PPK2) [Maioricimonas rarisocia]